MTDEPLNDPKALNCPWCQSDCTYIEHDDEEGSLKLGFRVGASCDEWAKAALEDKDAFGNDFGRTQWCDSREEAVDAWNYDVEHSIKENHKNYW